MDKSTQQPASDKAAPLGPKGRRSAGDGDTPLPDDVRKRGERTTPNLHLDPRRDEHHHRAPIGATAAELAQTVRGPATPPPEAGASDPPSLPSDVAIVANLGAIPGPLQQWERYQIQKLLGQGGMGTVFLARDRRLGRPVALKWLRVPSAEAAERLQQEARSQARLDHSGICKVFEVGEFHGQPYIAMEYINGQPLSVAMRHKNLEQKIMLMRQIALAVHAAHAQGILHRDIKPADTAIELFRR